MDNDLRELEEHLNQLAPAAMPEDMLARMEQAMSRWEQAEEPSLENVVAFPSAIPQRRSGAWFSGIAAAAAVVLVGAVGILMLQGDNAPAVAGHTTDVPSVSETPEEVLMGSSAGMFKSNRHIVNASEEGIQYNQRNEPQRVVRVEYEDTIPATDKDGKPCELKVNRVKYVVLPVEVH